MSRKPRPLVISFVWSVALTLLLAACGPAPAATPTSVPKPAPTAAVPKPAPTVAPAAKPAPPAAQPTVAPKPGPASAPTAAPAAQPATKPAAKPTGPSEWVVATTEETPTLDPAASVTLALHATAPYLFDSLIDFQGTSFKIVPMLAESWSLTDDRTWVFKIRKGVKFHNGDDLTADDVKYSIDTYRDEKSPRKIYVSEVASVDVVDQYTIKLTTRGPYPPLLVQLGTVFIMPRAAREKAGEEAFARNPIGSGPYKLGQFVRGQRLVFEANPNYWRGPVHPTKLTLRPIPDASTRVAELKTGGVHIAEAPPPARFKEIDTGDTQLVPLKAGRIIIYPFNTRDKPFDDVRVRQAVNYAIDRDAIIKNVLEGYGEPLHGPFASPWLGYDPDLKPYPFDPNKAKQLLTEAGYPNGLETVWSVSNGVFLRDREIAEVVKSQLDKVGIKVQLVPTERAKIQADWLNGVSQGMTSVQWGTTADPDSMLGWVLYKRKGHKPDEKLDSLIEQSRRTIDPDQRKKVLQGLGRYIQDQAYWMFIHGQDDFYAKRKDIPWTPLPGATGSFAATRYQLAGGN